METVDRLLKALVQSVADWQAAGLQRQGSSTGASLRNNFVLMADIVVKQDAHLLVDAEQQLLTTFKVQCRVLQQCFTPCFCVTINA